MISIDGVGMRYPVDKGSFEALQDINLEVRSQEFLTIIGPSGCGKTTLLKLVAGLAKPTAGEIRIEGKKVTGPGLERATVFQSFLLLPWATVIDNVAFGLKLRGVPLNERKERALHQIQRVGLEGFEGHYPHQLSGGMQQRVGIARALAVNPTILLMDEPFGALDAQTRQILQEDLLGIWQEERMTVIFITHSMDEAVLLSDRIVVMDTHPGRVRRIVEVPLPRPRSEEVRKSRIFTELVDVVWQELRAVLHKSGGFTVRRGA